jgi:hypothetical protein
VSDADGVEPDDRSDAERLREKLLDLLVFVPTGIVVSVAEELPKLAVRGRERLGVQVTSARAVGEFAVRMGGQELRRISGRIPPPPGRRPSPPPRPTPPAAPPASDVPIPESERAAPTVPESVRTGSATSGPAAGVPHRSPAATAASSGRAAPEHRVVNRMGNGNVPPVSTLAIPAFDTLSASQVVQRLDGLSREELVSVRAYETSTRGRRTILNRVDQLLEERA